MVERFSVMLKQELLRAREIVPVQHLFLLLIS